MMATQNKQDVIEKFNNGEQRYENDQYFKETVIALSYGVGVYTVLDKCLRDHARLIAHVDIQTKALEKGVEHVKQLQGELEADRVKSEDVKNRLHERLRHSDNETSLLKTQLTRESETVKQLQDELAGIKAMWP